jgi:hypothetical protein
MWLSTEPDRPKVGEGEAGQGNNSAGDRIDDEMIGGQDNRQRH